MQPRNLMEDLQIGRVILAVAVVLLFAAGLPALARANDSSFFMGPPSLWRAWS